MAYSPLSPHLTTWSLPCVPEQVLSFRSLDSACCLLPQDLCICCLCLAISKTYLSYLISTFSSDICSIFSWGNPYLAALCWSYPFILWRHSLLMMWLWIMFDSRTGLKPLEDRDCVYFTFPSVFPTLAQEPCRGWALNTPCRKDQRAVQLSFSMVSIRTVCYLAKRHQSTFIRWWFIHIYFIWR